VKEPGMILPPPIQAYFDADKSNDGKALVAAFSPDAVVKDEGQSHIGHHAIEAWKRATKSKYRHIVKPLDISAEHNILRVRARVTGDFPGSPATLTFAFRLQKNRIAHLEIGA
jgi:hypothetical protein